MKQSLTPILTAIYIAAALQLSGGQPVAELQASADSWASQQAAVIASDLTDNTADAVASIGISQVDAATVQAKIDRLYGASRAAGIAVTETTRAATAGMSFAAPLLIGINYRARTGGVVAPAATWMTSQAGSVCRICRPLHDKSRAVWSRRFPDGPPAHPQCNCYLVYEDLI